MKINWQLGDTALPRNPSILPVRKRAVVAQLPVRLVASSQISTPRSLRCQIFNFAKLPLSGLSPRQKPPSRFRTLSLSGAFTHCRYGEPSARHAAELPCRHVAKLSQQTVLEHDSRNVSRSLDGMTKKWLVLRMVVKKSQ